MSDPIFPKRWAPEHPDRIQLYSIATPNGVKIGVALEELELPYEAHRIHIGKGDQHDPEFLAISPNGKIPAIIDPTGPEPIRIFESGAILVHLAEKAGRLLPRSGPARAETLAWLFFQVGGVGPMFGQYGHFVSAAKDAKTTDDYARNRYLEETRRLLGVLNARLEHHEHLAGEYSIADIATAPWVATLAFYDPDGKDVSVSSYPHVERWLDAFSARPGVERGRRVCPF